MPPWRKRTALSRRRVQGSLLLLFALDHNVDRLAEDRANARRIAERLAESRFVELDPASVQTNIIVVRLAPDGPDAPSVVDRAERRGVLLFAFGPRSIQAVTHLDVSAGECKRAASLLIEAIETSAA